VSRVLSDADVRAYPDWAHIAAVERVNAALLLDGCTEYAEREDETNEFHAEHLL
jgi:hypothetical protein